MSAIARLFCFAVAVVVLLGSWSPEGGAAGDGWLRFAPGQVIVEFEPGVVDLPPNPGTKSIPIEDVPMSIPGLKPLLQEQGIIEFEIFARSWRWIDPHPVPDSLLTDHIPVTLKSFRDYYILHCPTAHPLEVMVEVLQDLPGIVSVGKNPVIVPPNYWPVDTLLVCPDGCGRNYQWNMENTGGTINGVECEEGIDIGVRGAYAIQETCTVKIGHMDSGADRDHPDLQGNLDTVLGRNFTTDPQDSMAWDDGGDWRSHGTQAAGIMAGAHSADSAGVAGICGLLREGEPVLVPMKVYDNASNPAHSDTASNLNSWVIEGLSYAGDRFPQIPIIVANVAMFDHAHGTHWSRLTPSEIALQRDAVHNAYHEGLFLAIPTGNDWPNQHEASNYYPAAFRHMVVGAAAIGCDGSRENGFYVGPNVDLSAPGHADDPFSHSGFRQIVSTVDQGGYGVDDGALFGGTCAAAPHVAGVAALLLSHTPNLTNEDLRQILQGTATDLGSPGYDETYGHGLIRADDALEALDAYELVHDSTSAIDLYRRVESCRVQRFKNIRILGWPSIIIGDEWDTLRVDVYRFEKTVSLTANTNPNHVPMIWVRGRQSISARDTVDYDGKFEPYHARIVSVSSTNATIRGYAYKVYGSDTPCVEDSLKGWFPLNPAVGSISTIFSYTYLADTSFGMSCAEPPEAPVGVREEARTYWLRGKGATIRYLSPTGFGGKLEIHDATGRLVQHIRLPDGKVGWRDVFWNGSDTRGRPLAAGLYFGRISAGGVEDEVRFVVLR